MRTLLYNYKTNEILGYYSDGYKVDGQEGIITNTDIIELKIIDNPITINNITEICNSNIVIDLENKEYRIEYFKRDKTAYEIAMEDWQYPQFTKRIIAPMQLVMEDIGSKMYNWFNINDFPIVKKEPIVHVYCNKILEEHMGIITAFEGIITIEDIPTDVETHTLKEPTQIQV